MKKLLLVVSITVFSFSNAIAVTLYDALNQTYQNNIQLNAERENIKASEEDINISQADYKPIGRCVPIQALRLNSLMCFLISSFVTPKRSAISYVFSLSGSNL
mgnify:CR=1 FL=1